jgi:hypothetical protein
MTFLPLREWGALMKKLLRRKNAVREMLHNFVARPFDEGAALASGGIMGLPRPGLSPSSKMRAATRVSRRDVQTGALG